LIAPAVRTNGNGYCAARSVVECTAAQQDQVRLKAIEMG
jgi:hypothetical protein